MLIKQAHKRSGVPSIFYYLFFFRINFCMLIHSSGCHSQAQGAKELFSIAQATVCMTDRALLRSAGGLVWALHAGSLLGRGRARGTGRLFETRVSSYQEAAQRNFCSGKVKGHNKVTHHHHTSRTHYWLKSFQRPGFFAQVAFQKHQSCLCFWHLSY